MSQNKSEQDLIKGCAENNRVAQKKLYEQFYSTMMGVCMRYASNADQAAEILNIGFLKIFNSIHKFNSNEGNLGGWMYRIMVNTSLDFLRAEMRHNTKDIDSFLSPVYDPSNVLNDLAANDLLELINSLSPAYRAVFNLYEIEGYTHVEIAKLLGISEGTSKSNLYKAKANLQKKVIALYEQKKVNYGTI